MSARGLSQLLLVTQMLGVFLSRERTGTELSQVVIGNNPFEPDFAKSKGKIISKSGSPGV
jgi:hypothetical protein